MKWLTGKAKVPADGLARVQSWMAVFFGEAHVTRPADEAALVKALGTGPYSCIGQSHSYNGIQVIPGITAFHMGQSRFDTLSYDPATQTATCGPSVKVLTLKQFLATKQRRMLNSGNYMEQTVIGALSGGTHGYGPEAVIAQAVTQLTFLDGYGQKVTLQPGDPDFPYAALSFGTIGPILSVTLRTAPVASYQSDAWVTRLSKKPALSRGAMAVSTAIVPYSDPKDPLIMLHTLRPASDGKGPRKTTAPLFSLAGLTEFLLRRLWALDRLFPSPEPLLKTQRTPDLLTGFFATTFTAYNLAFFVPLARADEVVRFLMLEAEKLRPLGFVLKSLIGVRELPGTSDLPFAGNFDGPVAAIDLFADVRDYAWLERLQRAVTSYFPGVRPHWGKSAIVEDFAASLGAQHIAALRALHLKHYPPGTLTPNEAVRKLFDLGDPAPASAIAKATA